MSSNLDYFSLLIIDLVKWEVVRVVLVSVVITGISLEMDINVEITNNLIILQICFVRINYKDINKYQYDDLI